MALTAVDLEFWQSLRKDDLVPLGEQMLELGQANWYGDVNPDVLRHLIPLHADLAEAGALLETLDRSLREEGPWFLFEIAEVFYRTFTRFREKVAIDLHGPPSALPLDLNRPVLTDREFGIVVNSGTAEHVFDQRQLWETVHDRTRPGGLMVHAVPLWGWLDHGFVNYHPTLIADVAAANGYGVLRWWYCELSPPLVSDIRSPEDFRVVARDRGTTQSTMMYVAWRKPDETRAFVVPTQGYYAGTLAPSAQTAWRKDR
jgi:hypothetical protein